MAAKRHLPVIATSTEDEGPKISSVQWVLLGALGIFLFWLPLGVLGLNTSAFLATYLHPGGTFGRYTGRFGAGLLSVGPLLLSFAMASFFGGALMGRYASGDPTRLSAYAGLLAAHVIVALTVVAGALRPNGLTLVLLLLLVLVAVSSAFFGGRWGRRRRV